jgi:hypothetical protein
VRDRSRRLGVLVQFLGALLLTVLSVVPAYGQGFSEPYWIGREIWVKPAKAAYQHIEFYQRPTFNSSSFFAVQKTKFRVEQVNKGWVSLRFIGDYGKFGEAYLPLSRLRMNHYNARGASRAEYERAAFFQQDPDEIAAALKAEESRDEPKKKRAVDALEKYQTWKHPAWKTKPRGKP